MSIRWPQLEREVQHKVKDKLRAAPDLLKKYKKLRRYSRHSLSGAGVARVFYLLLIVSFLLNIADKCGSQAFCSTLAIWALPFVLIRASNWFSFLYDSTTLNVLSLLPIKIEAVFMMQTRQFFIRSLWSFIDFTIVFLMLLLYRDTISSTWYFGLWTAILQWGIIVSLGLVFSLYFPQWITGKLIFILFAFALAITFGEYHSYPMETFRIFGWILPTAWPCQILLFFSTPGQWSSALLLSIPIFGIFYAGWIAFKRWHYLYCTVPENSNEPYDETPQEFDDQKIFPRTGVTELHEIIQTEMLKKIPWEKLGFIEKFHGKWFTPREKDVAEFLLASAPFWTKNFKVPLFILLLSLLCGFLPAPWNLSASIILGLIGFLTLLPVFGGSWPGLLMSVNYGVLTPFYSWYPIRFQEVAIVLWKSNTIKHLIGLPVTIFYGLMIAWIYQLPIADGCLIAAKGWLLAFFSQPLSIVGQLSQSTNDSSRIGIGLLFVFVIISELALAISIFFIARPSILLLMYSIYFLIALGSLKLYSALYNHCYFDLHAKSPTQ